MRSFRATAWTFLCALSLVIPSAGQSAASDAKAPAGSVKDETSENLASTTEHVIRLQGQSIPYRAATGVFHLHDNQGEATADLFYVAYTRTDVEDPSHRPVTFVYNGGPGSSSAWLHLAAFGPKRLVTPDAAAVPPAPYKLEENQHCLLDVTDLVFLDPVGSGFSHAIGKSADKDFWGVDPDLRSIGQAIRIYVSQNGRWNSPKFMIGESYGSFRAAAVVHHLQRDHGMSFNGIVMLSSVLNLGTLNFRPGEDLAYVLYLPSYAAAAWYHKALKDPPPNLDSLLADARRFAMGDYATALLKGAKLSAAEKKEIAQKMSGLTGLSEEYILLSDLRVVPSRFVKEIRRGKDLIGGLDGRFRGLSLDPEGEGSEYDPSLTGVIGAFTSSINDYLREELKAKAHREYVVLNLTAAGSWKYDHEGFMSPFPGSPNVASDLAQAIVQNPNLQVEVETGLYDIVTPFLEVEHTLDHLGLPEPLRHNVQLQYYEAGHMMYLHEPDLAKLSANVSKFIRRASSQ